MIELVLIDSCSQRDLFKDVYSIFLSYFGHHSKGLIEPFEEKFEGLVDFQESHDYLCFCLAAVENGRVLGGIGYGYYPLPNCAMIEHLALHKDSIGKGIGKRLLNNALQRISKGATKFGHAENSTLVFAETDKRQCSFNYNHLRLYSLGFRKLKVNYTMIPAYNGLPFLTDTLFLLVYKPNIKATLEIVKRSIPVDRLKDFLTIWASNVVDDALCNSQFISLIQDIDSASVDGGLVVDEMFPFTEMYGPSKTGDQIIVIGAGISGLSAAAELIKKGRNVTVLEAQDYFGGRSKSVSTAEGFPKVAMGCEFIHGEDTEVKQLADSFGWKYESIYANINEILVMDSPPSKYGSYPLARKATQILQEFYKEMSFASDKIKPQSLKSYLTNKEGLSSDPEYERLVALFNSIAQYFGAPLDEFGVDEAITFDESNIGYRILPTYDILVEYLLKQCTFVDKRRGWKVERINWNRDKDSKIEVVCNTIEGIKTLFATDLIVTVPLQLLKDNAIQFTPSLPQWKMKAIDNCRCSNAVKIVCRFSQQFWNPHRFCLFSPMGFFKHLWFYSIEEKEEGKKNSNNYHIAVGFATSNVADEISLMSIEKILELFLDQLNTMYSSDQSPHPATESYLNHEYIDWSRVQSIKCGYSYKNYLDDNAILDLGKPVDNKLYFAGEATSVEEYGTAEGAMMSGIKAAGEILEKYGERTEK